jgi:hypothetical protein
MGSIINSIKWETACRIAKEEEICRNRTDKNLAGSRLLTAPSLLMPKTKKIYPLTPSRDTPNSN